MNHGCIDACAKAFDLTDSEQAIIAGAVHLDVCEVLDGLNNVTGAAEHARCGAADLEMVLADLGAVEHGIERGDFVDLHGSHVEDLGDLVHGGEGQEVVVLLLRDEEGRDAGGLLVVGGVFAE